MKDTFLIIEGGLAAAPAPRRTIRSDKVVRFETSADHDLAPAPEERTILRALDDNHCFDLDPAEPVGCILDFEYNGVPARHGFLHD